jgi:hypothetical protein
MNWKHLFSFHPFNRFVSPTKTKSGNVFKREAALPLKNAPTRTEIYIMGTKFRCRYYTVLFMDARKLLMTEPTPLFDL